MDKFVTVESYWFKDYDDAVLVQKSKLRKQQIEAIIVNCKLEWLNEYFTVRRNGSGNGWVGKYDALINHEVVSPSSQNLILWHQSTVIIVEFIKTITRVKYFGHLPNKQIK